MCVFENFEGDVEIFVLGEEERVSWGFVVTRRRVVRAYLVVVVVVS